MKINKVALEAELINKFQNSTFQSIFNDAFIKSVPFVNQMSKMDIEGIAKYSKSVVESAGGIDIVYNAYETEKNPIKKSFLLGVLEACTKTATKAAKRIAEENKDTDTDDKDMSDIVKGAMLTKKEYEEFAGDKKELSLDKINEIISEKVVRVIKSEKEAYQKNEESKKELNDKLTDDAKSDNDDKDDKKDKAVDDIVDDDAEEELIAEPEKKKSASESLISLTMGNTAAYEHVSLFSTIQNKVCMGIINESTSYSDIPFNTIADVTIESTLPIFTAPEKSPLEALESAKIMTEKANDISTSDLDDIMSTSFESAIIVFTALETFHTLNLANVNSTDIKRIIDKKDITKDKKISSLVDYATEQLSANIKSAEKKVSRIKNYNDAVDMKNEIAAFVESYSSIGTHAADVCMESITKMDDRLTNLIAAYENVTPETMSLQDKRTRELNILKIGKLAKIAGMQNPSNKLRIEVPACESFDGYIEAKVISSDGKLVHESFAMLTPETNKLSPFDYVKLIAQESALMDVDSSVSLLLLDGTSRTQKILK